MSEEILQHKINMYINQIISDNDLNINRCNDNFYIVESWDQVKELEAVTNMSIDDVLGDWGFSDEYLTCEQCNNSIILYTYDMADYHIFKEGFIMCGNCIRADKDFSNQYIDEIINKTKTANTILKDNDLDNMGFIKCNCKDQDCNFSAGLREGYQDKPEEILKNAMAKNPGHDFIFDITNVDMFETSFTIWRREKEI